MPHRHVFRFLLLLLLTLSHLVWGDTLVGKCVWVTDGDTATVKTESGEKYTVRFQGIDAPESAQSYGKEAKEALMGLILNKKCGSKFKEQIIINARSVRFTKAKNVSTEKW